MKTKMKYQAKQPDKNGYIEYTSIENSTWNDLYNRQVKTIENRACDEFLLGLKQIGMPTDRVPQLADISSALIPATGWSVTPVPALISTEVFFNLLLKKQFPAATFIRIPEELDYLEEPDIFHEFFGHCPMLMNQTFADFMHEYAKLTLTLSNTHDQELMARLFWFTVEFGLIETNKGLRCYGGGILSSHGETKYALDSDQPVRQPFALIDVLRTPYRIDIMQPIYFIIKSFEQLFDSIQSNLTAQLEEAKCLGEFVPRFKHEQMDNEEWVTC